MLCSKLASVREAGGSWAEHPRVSGIGGLRRAVAGLGLCYETRGSPFGLAPHFLAE